MNARFSITLDRTHGALLVRMAGFFTPPDVTAFRADVTRKLRDLGCAPNRHLMLCDVSGMKIQAQEIVGAFTQIVGNPEFRSRRLAFVTGSSLARMQAQRLTTRPGVRFFSETAAAEAWLFAETAEAEGGGAGNGDRTRITSLEG